MEEVRFRALIGQLEGVTFSNALTGEVLSMRLATALTTGLGERPMVELFTGDLKFRAQLLKNRNFGQKTFAELEALCRRAAILTLNKTCSDPQTLLLDCAVLFNIPTEGIKEGELKQKIFETLHSEPPQNCGLDQLVDWALHILPHRELNMITWRYGLTGEAAQTLSEVGASYNLTPQRVRQLESAALRRLQSKLNGTPLMMLVDHASAHFWERRNFPFVAITQRDSNLIRNELPVRLVLALDIIDLSICDWLTRTSTAMSNGYLAGSLDARKVRSLGRRLEERLKDQPLPIAVADAVGKQDSMLVQAAVCLETAFFYFESYLLCGRPSARLKRTVRLHALMSATISPITLCDLRDLYYARYPENSCSLRDLVIVMELSPHLFLEIEEGLWMALGHGAQPVANRLPEVARPARWIAGDKTTLVGSIQDTLRTRGPTLSSELFRDGADIVPFGRSRNSIGPILVSRPDLFIRILPGIFALPDQVPDLAETLYAPLPYWLTEAQGRTYAFARKAGEKGTVFPLWTPAAEYRLCTWARDKGSPALFRSLLAIAEIDTWPIKARQKAEWARFAVDHGRFELALPGIGPAQVTPPEISRLCAACYVAFKQGSIGWLQINRIMGRRLDALGGQSLLALMIALGTVRVPAGGDDAMLCTHVATSRALEIADRIAVGLVHHGELRWSSDLGRELIADALAADPAHLGWVSLEELHGVLGTKLIESALSTGTEVFSKMGA